MMYALKILFSFLKVALATTKILYSSSAFTGPFWLASEIVSGQPLTDLSVATVYISKMLTKQESLFLILGKHTLILQNCLIMPNHCDIEKNKTWYHWYTTPL